MRRSTRMVAGAVLAAGLGPSGCGGDDQVDIDEDDNTVLDDGTEDQGAGGTGEDGNTRLEDNTEDRDAGSVDGGADGDDTSDVG